MPANQVVMDRAVATASGKANTRAVAGGTLGGAIATVIMVFAPLAEWAGNPPGEELAPGIIAALAAALTVICSAAVRKLKLTV